jgi:ABC-type antimicrobial peptide transport system permease subunit
MVRLVAPNLRSWRLGATMFAAFGGLALVLAAVGLYSLVAYDVEQRRREVSVRIALGATVARVMSWVVRRAARLVVVGLAVGGSAAFWAVRWLEPQLFKQEPRDPSVFGAVMATLLAVGVIAAAGPAYRASRVDPNDALREE